MRSAMCVKRHVLCVALIIIGCGGEDGIDEQGGSGQEPIIGGQVTSGYRSVVRLRIEKPGGTWSFYPRTECRGNDWGKQW